MLLVLSNVQTRVSPGGEFPVQLHVGAAAGHCIATNPKLPAKLPEMATPSVDVAAKLFGITVPSEPNADQLVESFAPVPSHNDRTPAPAVPVVSKTKTGKTHPTAASAALSFDFMTANPSERTAAAATSTALTAFCVNQR